MASTLLLPILIAGAVAAAVASDGSVESDFTYQSFLNRGEIVAANDPLYAPLERVGERIARAASGGPKSPPRFVLLHDPSPNAFAMPDGIVYVTDSLMGFVDNREELAGILCHETAHWLAGDADKTNARSGRTAEAISIAGALTGMNRTIAGIAGEDAAQKIEGASYSRELESAADARGAELCARAGINPWGLVWLFTKFERSDRTELEILSDHPSEEVRIDALEDLFRDEPELYAKFPIDIRSASSP